MSDTTAPSSSVEGTPTATVEVTAPQIEAPTTPTPEVPTTEATPANGGEPVEPDTPVLSDEEVDAIVAEMLKDIPS